MPNIQSLTIKTSAKLSNITIFKPDFNNVTDLNLKNNRKYKLYKISRKRIA